MVEIREGEGDGGVLFPSAKNSKSGSCTKPRSITRRD